MIFIQFELLSLNLWDTNYICFITESILLLLYVVIKLSHLSMTDAKYEYIVNGNHNQHTICCVLCISNINVQTCHGCWSYNHLDLKSFISVLCHELKSPIQAQTNRGKVTVMLHYSCQTLQVVIKLCSLM